MIAARNTDVQVQSNIGGEKIAMGIHAEAMSHIMGLLTDAYSDPVLACIREYSTNALDAHIEAGNPAPIEVTLPTPLAQFFTVRDHGVGLSFQDIKAIYSQYGASTKRHSNDVVGMLGIGCKAALAYTDQFILASVKDGERVQVAVSRDADGSGGMTVVSRTATGDPNGTMVQIPVKAQNDFARKAADFFRWWKPGTVLVNGKQPEAAEGLRVSDDLMVIPGRQNYCIMGNVAYPVDQYFNSGLSFSGVAMWVPIGSVSFPASREALTYNTTTRDTLAKMSDKLRKELPGAIQREVDKCATAHEALALCIKWRKAIPSNLLPPAFSYKSMQIPAEYRDPSGEQATIVPSSSRVLSRHSRAKAVAIDLLPNALFFHNYHRLTFTSAMKKKMLKWAEDNGVQMPEHCILLRGKPTDKWLRPEQIKDWAEVEAIKLPRKERDPITGRIPGSYDFYTAKGFHDGVPGDQIDQTQPIFYGDRYEVSSCKGVLRNEYPNCTIVILHAGRVDKFKRNVPKAKHVREGVKEAYQKWADSLSLDDRKAMTIQVNGYDAVLATLDAGRIKDPEVVATIKLAKRSIPDLLARRQMFQRHVNIDRIYVKFDNPLDKYPLVPRYRPGLAGEHTYLYMNMIYDLSKA